MPSVDFDAVKRTVTLGEVLYLIGWKYRFRERGDVLGWCPLCGFGLGWERCFRVRGERWKCYRCERSGGALDLYAQAKGKPLLPAVKELLARLGKPVPYVPRQRRKSR